MIDHQKELHGLKLQVARSQLGTALALFIENKDPISVHTLACAGGEVIDELAKHKKEERFTNHILETYPDLDEGKLEDCVTSIGMHLSILMTSKVSQEKTTN